ncbi:bile acid:sodium symporter family protein [Oceanimonas sp. CHS3-5]|uniref:bile acid:sodium symporter family protein n=1 Tax=Oceanimonas sp. CHS3-5 TaxID=3068186 RepID=UPI00273D3674|nr:bile acid:sodium symporter family protein [Oceanimonas sp. CHS3-5]MDP5291462.1 bile acid:sodium symporter family protein [Oceanimonas sp. CHS3-5]
MFGYSRLLFDKFTLVLLAVVATASLFPAHGVGAVLFDHLTTAAIALLFFMHGAKLSRQAIVAGATHWRLHLLVFGCTFVLFPLIGLLLKPVLLPLLGESLYMGVLFLCVLPGTVQSAIAFTSLAGGNVPAAVCSASASSILGIVLTPLLVAALLNMQAGAAVSPLDSILSISVQLLLPFAAGHLLRPLIGGAVDRNRAWLGKVDQGSILLVVYTALSASVVEGLWHTVSWSKLAILTLVCCALLALILCLTTVLGRRLGFNREDRITIVFGGSKKSMATGVPMAKVLFAGAMLGPALLPLMIFHQIQLMVCAVLAQKYAREREPAFSPEQTPAP